jgi:hypothetical protein
MVIESCHSTGNMKDAYKYITMMEQRKIPLASYVDTEIVNEVYTSMGISKNAKLRRTSNTVNEMKEEEKIDSEDEKEKEEEDEIDEVK